MVVRHLIHNKRQIHPHRFAIGAGTGAAFTEGDMIVVHSGRHSVRLGLLLRFSHQRRKCRQRGELAVSKKIAYLGKTI